MEGQDWHSHYEAHGDARPLYDLFVDTAYSKGFTDYQVSVILQTFENTGGLKHCPREEVVKLWDEIASLRDNEVWTEEQKSRVRRLGKERLAALKIVTDGHPEWKDFRESKPRGRVVMRHSNQPRKKVVFSAEIPEERWDEMVCKTRNGVVEIKGNFALRSFLPLKGDDVWVHLECEGWEKHVHRVTTPGLVGVPTNFSERLLPLSDRLLKMTFCDEVERDVLVTIVHRQASEDVDLSDYGFSKVDED